MGFDFTASMRRVCEDVTLRVSGLSHVDMDRIAIGYRQTRQPDPDGLQASLTPLRFEEGAEVGTIRGKRYRCSRVFRPAGGECLYVLNFYLPRFLDHPLEEKLTTLAHELWHVGPGMDGDLRRHPGRCYAHGRSQTAFDTHAAALAREWLAADPPPGLLALLEPRYDELLEAHGAVVGDRYRAAKLLAVKRARARSSCDGLAPTASGH